MGTAFAVACFHFRDFGNLMKRLPLFSVLVFCKEALNVKKICTSLPLLLILATSAFLPGQAPTAPGGADAAKPAAAQSAPASSDPKAAKKADKTAKKVEVHLKPVSHIAFGAGMSSMGVNLQTATNLNRYLNLRASGNFFNYTASNISTNGFNMTGKVNLASAGLSLDYFPNPRSGFRVSPGLLFYNQNNVSAFGVGAPGSSIKLNQQTFYTDSVNPLNASANLGLNTHQQAFTLTTGWGNLIPRKSPDQLSSHLTFPFEIGAAFTGAPTLNMSLLGNACTNQADAAINGASCVNMATDPTAKNDLSLQLNKWRSDVNPLKVYPIFSFGVAYSFSPKPQ
jgi:hypothetical protein